MGRAGAVCQNRRRRFTQQYRKLAKANDRREVLGYWVLHGNSMPFRRGSGRRCPQGALPLYRAEGRCC